jgi:PBP1b-binding outer membrane lipoprotein LpoB
MNSSSKKRNGGKQVKKRVAAVGLLVVLLSGCSEMELEYKGEVRSEYEVEEIIADELEANDPSLDLEVNIMTESDD